MNFKFGIMFLCLALAVAQYSNTFKGWHVDPCTGKQYAYCARKRAPARECVDKRNPSVCWHCYCARWNHYYCLENQCPTIIDGNNGKNETRTVATPGGGNATNPFV